MVFSKSSITIKELFYQWKQLTKVLNEKVHLRVLIFANIEVISPKLVKTGWYYVEIL